MLIDNIILVCVLKPSNCLNKTLRWKVVKSFSLSVILTDLWKQMNQTNEYLLHITNTYTNFVNKILSLNMYPKCTFTVHFIFVFKIFLTKKRSVDSKHALYCYLTSVVILLRVHTSIFKKRPIKYVKNALYPKYLLDK